MKRILMMVFNTVFISALAFCQTAERATIVFKGPCLGEILLTSRPQVSPFGVALSGPASDSMESKIDFIFRDWIYPRSPGGAIAIVNKGELIFMKGYGCADLEHSVAMTPSTKVYMASISKQFTGYCIAKLIREGKIALDDDIRKYIPEMARLRKPIKVRDLVYQKSGLRDLYGLVTLIGLQTSSYLSNNDVLKILHKQRDLNFLPGEEWEYSNTNYLLLAEIIKRITGETIKKCAQKVIFGPLHMEDTFFVDSIETLIPLRANSYRQNKDRSFSNDPFLDVTVGHTGLYSTIEDMSKWLIHLRDMYRRKDAVLTLMLQADTLNNGQVMGNYSFGLYKTSGGALNYWHRGSLFGYKSIITYYPEKDFGLVIAGNVNTFNRRRYATEVTRLFYPELAPIGPLSQSGPVLADSLKQQSVVIDEQRLRKYDGHYVVDSMTVYKIDVRNNSLALSEVSVSSAVNLIPVAQNQFRNSEGTLLVSFSENNLGVVDRMFYQESSTKATGGRGKVLSTAQENEVIGDYYNDELEISIKITKTSKGLEGSNLMLGKIDLYPTYEDQFRCDHDFFSRMTLYRNSMKRIEGFLVSGFTVRNVRFVKIEEMDAK
jgi:CubicO group peptidase (beta-lactamase class C family)